MSNVTPQLTYTNSWFLVSGAVWRGRGTSGRWNLAWGSTLWKQTLRVYSLASFLVLSLCIAFTAQNVIRYLHTVAVCCSASHVIMDSPSGTVPKINFPPYLAFHHGVLLCQPKNNWWTLSKTCQFTILSFVIYLCLIRH